ncbi:MAG: TonB-dependent receptor [Dysgonamonadaceae bacterium]|jgi:outer membrane receptor protein involved in Fe transport|nr:TonB-dependent receptor [Dysgonamonadaceae bacterium]
MSLKRLISEFIFFIIPSTVLFAENSVENNRDSISLQYLDEVVVSASVKETNDLQRLPASVSFITPSMIEGQKIISIKNLSAIIPNFFIPDYGSKLSTPVYIRGIGERSSAQSFGMYIDNMPVLDKSLFDFDFMDIRQIEVLRGTQGTLYGRNAMSGVVNISTQSPLQSQYEKIMLTGGNYGHIGAKITVSELLSKNTGILINAYYNENSGYFTNQFTGKKADRSQLAGGKIRFDWKINSQWTARITLSADSSRQGAFPYGKYVAGKISAPDCDYSGNYGRGSMSGNLNLNYKNEYVIFNSATSFTGFRDDMKMDVDNSREDVFRLNQLQKERSWTEELTLKSNSKSNYQWSFGLFGFYLDLQTDVRTIMGGKGIETILQPAFTKISENNPRAPKITVDDTEIPIPGTFKTPVYGGAIFHQSTFNNLFTEGLSLTAGVRLDYEKTRLDYVSGSDINLNVAVKAGPTVINMDSTLSVSLQGKEQMKFKEVLPKIALKYAFNSRDYIYASVSNGYKTGGYNIQNFADITQDAIREKYDKTFKASSVSELTPYQPEYSWNYEVGFKGNLFNDFLYAELATFYIDAEDIQLTEFVNSGQGRIIKNAGKAQSIGFECGIAAALTDELRVNINYGFTSATFKDYKTNRKDKNELGRDTLVTVNYSGKYIPFAPQNTLSLGALYTKGFKEKWIDGFNLYANYNAVGKIYWTEKNDVHQDFYGILNIKAGINKGNYSFSIWTNNTLNTDYAAFYFESMDSSWAQKGRPFTFGADFIAKF